jgi:competence protein ComEC
MVATAALLATTVVATLATAPFGSFHFQTINPFGLLGNALAVPLVSVVVMPCAVIGVLAFPFGLDRPLWEVMGFAVAQVLRVSHWVGDFSGSTLVVPAFGAEALALMALGLVTLTLMISPLRLAAIVPAAAGLWLAAWPQRFDLYVDRDGAGAAVRGANRQLVMLGRAPAFVVEQWLKADGDGRKADDASLRAGVRCDGLGCVAELPDARSIALVRDRRAFAEDCRRAAFVITRLAAPPDCRPPVLLDRAFFAAHGATALRLTAARHDIVTTRRPDESRPWLRRAGSGQARKLGPPAGSANAPARAPPDEDAAEPQPFQ